MGFSKIKKFAPGSRWLLIHMCYQRSKGPKDAQGSYCARNYHTQGEKLLCAPKHSNVRLEMRVEESRQCKSGCLAVASAHPQPTSCHFLYQDHSKLERFDPQRLILSEKGTNSSQPLQATQLCELQPPMPESTPLSNVWNRQVVPNSYTHATLHSALVWSKPLVLPA